MHLGGEKQMNVVLQFLAKETTQLNVAANLRPPTFRLESEENTDTLSTAAPCLHNLT